MLSVWEVKMRALLYLLLAAGCVLADKNDNRRNKLPFVADAVGNSLPPPSNVPATVGSPVNLLTPDRYEFYTFDESGELVKRLMTLEEIQAIVAAGEETEGLVTFANDNQPTVTFNMNQPPHTKVHSVVTNVQNVLKAQMEAHKNKPHIQPTLDTPDVSDSWSLILPSIFGNTGVDIVLDKASSSVTPETETLSENVEDDENSLTKEGSYHVISTSTTAEDENIYLTEKIPLEAETKEVPTTTSTTTTTTTTTTTPRPTSTTRKPTRTTRKPTTTTRKPTTTTRKPITTTRKPTTTTRKLTTTTKAPTTTTKEPTTTTDAPTTTTKAPTTTTETPSTTTKVPRTTTTAPTTTTKAPTTTTKAATTTIKLSTTTTKAPTTTTRAPTTTTKTPTTTTIAPTISTTTSSTTTTTSTTTRKPMTSTTVQPSTENSPISSISNVWEPLTKVTTNQRTTTTTAKPTPSNPVIITTVKLTTAEPEVTTQKHSVNVLIQESQEIKAEIQSSSNAVSPNEKNEIEYEKISTFIPISTVTYITDHTTSKTMVATELPMDYASTTKRSVITSTKAQTTETPKIQTLATTSKPVISTLTYISGILKDQESDKYNFTTITTQSVAPSTTIPSTDLASVENVNKLENKPAFDNNETESEPMIPLFDVAQSISQIASDLGGSYQPLPTTSNLLDTANVNVLGFESKEVLDMDMPSAAENETSGKIPDELDKNDKDNFIKITTIDPHDKNEIKNNSVKETNLEKNKPTETDTKVSDVQNIENNESESTHIASDKVDTLNVIVNNIQKVELVSTTLATELTTMDPFLSESMGDLLLQVVNEAPQSIIDSDKISEEDMDSITTEESEEPTTVISKDNFDTTSEISTKVKKETVTTTENPSIQIDDGTNTTENILNSNSNSSLESSMNKETEFQVENSTETLTKLNSTKVDNTKEQNIIVDNSEHFVQISVSANNKNDPKVEPVVTNNGDNFITSTDNYAELKDVVKINKEEKITKNGNKTSEVDIKRNQSIEISTTDSNWDISLSGATPSKITALKINNRKDKLPTELQKVDEFKKKIQKVNIDEEEIINERNNSWKLIPTLSPPKANEIPKDKVKSENNFVPDNIENKDIVLDFSNENQGLQVTTRDLGEDIGRFSELSNELAFRFWNVMIDDIDKKRSFVLSPYSIFSMLAMIFMGARGATSGEMNEILKLDDMVTFNPHFTLKNISDSIDATPESGVAVSAFIRELYSDRNKGKILTFYKERAQHFYNGHVEEINFKLISDIIRRRTNLLVKRYTWGKIPEYMKTNNIVMQTPLAAFTANIYETDCSGSSVEGRDGEMYFVVSPNVRQRRLVPVPAVVYKSGFLAGYDSVLDATVAALGNTNTIVSTLFLMPGQQGNVVHADDLEKLEQRLLEASPTTPTWNRMLRSLLPRTGLELQIPRFSHKSTFNVSLSLRKMGLKDLFDGNLADLGGLNGPSKDLYLSDMVQLNTFTTCGEGVVGEQHHIEEYPETLSVSQRRRARWLNDWDEPRDYQRAFHDPHDVGDAMHLPLHLRPRQARLPSRNAQPARLKFDRPFLFFVRHNPSGMILYFGRYNPRLLP